VQLRVVLAWANIACFFFVTGAGFILLVFFAMFPVALIFARVGLLKRETPFALFAFYLSMAPLAVFVLLFIFLFVFLALQTMYVDVPHDQLERRR